MSWDEETSKFWIDLVSAREWREYDGHGDEGDVMGRVMGREWDYVDNGNGQLEGIVK